MQFSSHCSGGEGEEYKGKGEAVVFQYLTKHKLTASLRSTMFLVKGYCRGHMLLP